MPDNLGVAVLGAASFAEEHHIPDTNSHPNAQVLALYSRGLNRAKEMADRTGAETYRLMPTIRFFKIGVNFDMVKNESAADEYYSPDGYNQSDPESWNKAAPVTDFEIGTATSANGKVTYRPWWATLAPI